MPSITPPAGAIHCSAEPASRPCCTQQPASQAMGLKTSWACASGAQQASSRAGSNLVFMRPFWAARLSFAPKQTRINRPPVPRQDLPHTLKLMTVWLLVGLAIFLGFKAWEQQRVARRFQLDGQTVVL